MTGVSLAGKVALITGAGRGFGQAIGELFAAEGADLAVSYLNSQAGCEQIADHARAAGQRALVMQADVTDEAANKRLVAQCLEEFGRIDILVNNAGVMTVGNFAESGRAGWDYDIQTNIYGPLMLTREVLPHMIERRSGRIINLSSQLAINGAAEVSVYSGTKVSSASGRRRWRKRQGSSGST
jgi:3-oxoacyl-[acyl-carrier protein] reductase